ncbi:MAG: CvpA family protein [Bacteroidales bacterium]
MGTVLDFGVDKGLGFMGQGYVPAGLDWVLWFLLLLALIQGYRSGLVKQLFSLAGIIGGLFFARFWQEVAETWLVSVGVDRHWAGVAGYIGIVLLFFLAMVIAGGVVTMLVNLTPVGFLNRGAGIFFSLLQGAFILGLLCMGLEFLNEQYAIFPDGLVERSQLFQFLSRTVRLLLFPGEPPFFWPKPT